MPNSPVEQLRQHVIALFLAGVAAAEPGQAVRNVLSVDGGLLKIGLDLQDKSRQRIGGWRKIHLLAFGKAACAMAEAARQIIPPQRLAGSGLAVTTYENIRAIDGIEVIGAGHPLPDNAGLQAGKRVACLAAAARQGELLLVLISGGGSALLPAPVEPITLSEKIAVTALLLASGAGINQINCVRKHLSQLKGGGLARLAAPADLHALILSDVLGDDPSAIASGPTVADDSRFADAVGILSAAKIWEKIPPSVQNHLQQGVRNLQAETPKPGDALFGNTAYTLVGSNIISIEAMLKACAEYPYQARLYSNQLCGEARIAAQNLAAHARNLQTAGLNQPIAIIAGGETTVTLSGNGKGGRNQEMALAFALAAEQNGLSGAWTFLSGGTDGRDGPTDAAGGIADIGTLRRIRQAGLDPQHMLDDHDSYPALQAANDLLMTGATGTNVADLQILLLHPADE
ncbi:MAG: DUF4147 domain-containing protein [Methylococcales bacterium]|nr:DUF4147 domain-containing protein [Methylococcales bacterium]